jgi:hypothetical protein
MISSWIPTSSPNYPHTEASNDVGIIQTPPYASYYPNSAVSATSSLHQVQYPQYQTMKVAVPPAMGHGQQIFKSKQQMDYSRLLYLIGQYGLTAHLNLRSLL